MLIADTYVQLFPNTQTQLHNFETVQEMKNSNCTSNVIIIGMPILHQQFEREIKAYPHKDDLTAADHLVYHSCSYQTQFKVCM